MGRDPLWDPPPGGWPSIVDPPMGREPLTDEQIAELKRIRDSPEYNAELEKMLAPYQNPTTRKALDFILD